MRSNLSVLKLSAFWIVALFHVSSYARGGNIPTNAARANTLQLLTAASTNGATAQISQKCAIILYGKHAAEIARAESNSVTIAVTGPPNATIGCALAAGIDTNGYFLTAAHVAEQGPLTLIFHDGTRLRAETARVVAEIFNPDRRVEKLDLALLHVPGVNLASVLPVSDANPNRKEIVLEVGAAEKQLLSETNLVVRTAPFAGHVKNIWALSNGGSVIETDLPSRSGDSGGPLLSVTGELLAIHSGTHRAFFGRRSGIATRPALDWLRDAIKTDQQTFQAQSANVPLRYSGEPGYITVRFTD
jgi:S1-C subfamily serine protease